MDEQRRERQSRIGNVTRRTFLKGSAGAMATLAVAKAYQLDAVAQEENPALTGYQFFNANEAQSIDALAEVFWPTTDDSPGGSDAGVVYYIDGALSGIYRDYQGVYRQGVTWLNDAANEAEGSNFAGLELEQQTAVVQGIYQAEEDADEADDPAGQDDPDIPQATPAPGTVDELETDEPTLASGAPVVTSLYQFVEFARNHTMEGLFSDPVHGGNRDFAGWRAVGYPGPYYVYDEEQQQSFEPLDLPLQSVADL